MNWRLEEGLTIIALKLLKLKIDNTSLYIQQKIFAQNKSFGSFRSKDDHKSKGYGFNKV